MTFHLTNRWKVFARIDRISTTIIAEARLVVVAGCCSKANCFGSMQVLLANHDWVRRSKWQEVVSDQRTVLRRTTVLWLKVEWRLMFDCFYKFCTVLQVHEFSFA